MESTSVSGESVDVQPMELARFILLRIDEVIRYSNTKADFLLALSGVLLLLLVTLPSFFRAPTQGPNPLPRPILVLIVISAAADIGAVISALMTIRPHPAPPAAGDRPVWVESSLFFGSIARIGPAVLRDRLQHGSADAWIDDLAAQISICARIAVAKFRWVALATWFLIAGAVMTLATIAVTVWYDCVV